MLDCKIFWKFLKIRIISGFTYLFLNFILVIVTVTGTAAVVTVTRTAAVLTVTGTAAAVMLPF